MTAGAKYQSMTVSIEAARALQGVGFDLPCDYGYSSTATYFGTAHSEPKIQEGQEQHTVDIPAPDILTAVMWLWEKYGVWCLVEIIDSGEFDSWALDRSSGHIKLSAPVTTTDPTTAYNAAIIAACEYIKQQKT